MAAGDFDGDGIADLLVENFSANSVSFYRGIGNGTFRPRVNYGTGKDVSDESIADATVPLEVRWRNDSYVQIPIWK